MKTVIMAMMLFNGEFTHVFFDADEHVCHEKSGVIIIKPSDTVVDVIECEYVDVKEAVNYLTYSGE